MGQPMSKNLTLQHVQLEVTGLLKREVDLMREILASMYEEERAIVDQDPRALQMVMQKRDAPLQNLMSVREERGQKIKELLLLLNGHDKKELTDLLESKGLGSSEVLLLRDQIIALIERMNVQNATIDHLMQRTSHLWKDWMTGSLPSEYAPIFPLMEKRKAIMLTVINPEL